ncbi:SemiSWEET family sugar transporter [Spirobacillus cienkowskii]|jgi:MtN3 and saliva related transmembrane protein|uniref:Glutathione synthetase n=1 Tax=Spirobacillus cienkowskii TaxID=495820 RepID=A0A369KPL0_9BACT|nr:MAG: glutathione synthetase [Spirobacillus cienkowskii]
MDEYLPSVIGYLAAFLTTFSFLPQAIKTIKTRCTKGISTLMYTLFTIGIFFWLVYGVLVEDKIIIAANVITFIFACIILFISFYNLKKENNQCNKSS